ncbi:MAG: helix-turn-helix transcriptional regulator [Eubacteriales bacterium]|nr:helix-turn-helix transcriptional regulator [Eubacteriales bacterium]
MSTIQGVGERIKGIRTEMKMTQKQFGELVGISGSQVGAYENGKTPMRLDIFFDIAKAVKIKPEELIRSSKESDEPEWDAELRIYNMEDRKQVMTILAVNGYDVGQHKRAASPTGKTINYYVHAKDRQGNADTSK